MLLEGRRDQILGKEAPARNRTSISFARRLRPDVLEGSSVITKRQALGQLILCMGCCCGRTDRGRPEVPVERIKATWQREQLNRTIQLTISGCLGPCDVPNVALLLLPPRTEWLGHPAGGAAYEELIQWGAGLSHGRGAGAPSRNPGRKRGR